MIDQRDILYPLAVVSAFTLITIFYARLRFRHLATRRRFGKMTWRIIKGGLGRDSILLARTGPARDFNREFTSQIRAGTTLLIPVGDGCYTDHVDEEKGNHWLKTLRRVILKGATVYVIVTAPNDRASRLWEPLIMSCGDRFRFVTLDRSKASPQHKIEIERLDSFHPVLLFHGDLDEPLVLPKAMWIEHYHPPGQAEAYDVEMIGPKSVRRDERFEQYLGLFRTLLASDAATIRHGVAESEANNRAA